MNINNFRNLFILAILIGFLPQLNADDRRVIPLDMYLIIDGSESLKDPKNGIVAWINEQVIDRILTDGDKITVWTAGEKAEIIYSEIISGSAGKKDIKDKLQALKMDGKTADFSGALREASSRISQTGQNRSRLSYTILITGSAEGLEPTLTANAQGTLRWFRSEQYARWQILVVAPDIGGKVRQSAASYMASLR